MKCLNCDEKLEETKHKDKKLFAFLTFFALAVALIILSSMVTADTVISYNVSGTVSSNMQSIYLGFGEQFIAGSDHLTNLSMYLAKDNTPTGNLTFHLYNDSGSNTLGVLVQSDIAKIDVSTLTGSFLEYYFILNVSGLILNDDYWIVMQNADGTSWDGSHPKFMRNTSTDSLNRWEFYNNSGTPFYRQNAMWDMAIWTEVEAQPTNVSYNVTGTVESGIQTAYLPFGQQFRAQTTTINNMILPLKKVGTPTGNLSFSVFADSGGNTLGGLWYDAIAKIDVATLTTDFLDYNFSINLNNLTELDLYWIVMYPEGASVWDGSHPSMLRNTTSSDRWDFYNNSGTLTYRQNADFDLQLFYIEPPPLPPINSSIVLINSVSIIPVSPFDNETLLCYGNAGSSVNATMTINHTWYNGTTFYSTGIISANNNTNTLLSTLSPAIHSGENWNCSIFAYDDFNTSSSTTFGVSVVTTPLLPVVDAISPANETTVQLSPITLQCNGTGQVDYPLTNMTFTIWNSTAQINITTFLTSGETNTTEFIYSFPEQDTYHWTCTIVNSFGYFATGENRSMTYNIPAPVTTWYEDLEAKYPAAEKTVIYYTLQESGRGIFAFVNFISMPFLNLVVVLTVIGLLVGVMIGIKELIKSRL